MTLADALVGWLVVNLALLFLATAALIIRSQYECQRARYRERMAEVRPAPRCPLQCQRIDLAGVTLYETTVADSGHLTGRSA